ncbi:MAG: phophatidylserine decarboxylase associated domain-containing protein [Kiloniellaceae bacterium]
MKKNDKALLDIGDIDPIQMGFWVPNRVWATQDYLIPLRIDLAERKRKGLLPEMSPAILEFRRWIETHSIYRMWVHKMLRQINDFIIALGILSPETVKQIREDGDVTKIITFDDLFDHLNVIITTSPGFNETAMVGPPMNGLLAVAMGTPAGAALFHAATFNAQFKKVLDAWNGFLKSDKSLDKLDIQHPDKKGSWISPAARKAGVWTDMVHDKNKPGYGYDSWNAFFIREFVPGARPFHGDAKKVINIGCETTPWQYENKVPAEAEFWIKDMPYSPLDLLGGDRAWAEKFAGGQVYQGFLSATHYHRWQAPLDGTIVRSWVEPGTYFAQRQGQGEDKGTWEGTQSQPYLGNVAARAIFIMEHEAFGFVAMICIGMVEVSTCHITFDYLVDKGAPPRTIRRGDPIGHFEFGGSTHVMMFQKDRAKLEDWAVHAVKNRTLKQPITLGSVIDKLT